MEKKLLQEEEQRHKQKVEKLKEEFSNIETVPNMLLIGDAGVGKTTVAKVLCETLNIDFMICPSRPLKNEPTNQNTASR